MLSLFYREVVRSQREVNLSLGQQLVTSKDEPVWHERMLSVGWCVCLASQQLSFEHFLCARPLATLLAPLALASLAAAPVTGPAGLCLHTRVHLVLTELQ